MQNNTTKSTFEESAYWCLLLVFNLFLLLSWMPRVTTFGNSDVGIAAVMLAAMVPLLLVLPKQTTIDRTAWNLRLIIVSAIGFVMFWGYLGMFRSDNPLRAGRLMLSLGQGIIIILVISRGLSPRAIRFSLGLCLVMLTILSLLSLHAYLGGQTASLMFRETDRSSGLFKNPNQFGIIASMGIPFATAFLFQYRKTALALLILLAVTVGLLLSGSKTNIIISTALLFASLMYCLIIARRAGFLLIITPVMALLLWLFGLPLLEFFNPRAAHILTELLVEDNGQSNRTVDQRFEMWQHSIDVMKSSPLFGAGTGQKIDVVSQIHSHSHNLFMDLGRTTGIPGLVGGMLFILASCWLAVRSLARLSDLPGTLGKHLHGRALIVGAAFATLSYVLSNQMSDSLGPSTSVFFWLTIGVLLRRNDLIFFGNETILTDFVNSRNTEHKVAIQKPFSNSVGSIS